MNVEIFNALVDSRNSVNVIDLNGSVFYSVYRKFLLDQSDAFTDLLDNRVRNAVWGTVIGDLATVREVVIQ